MAVCVSRNYRKIRITQCMIKHNKNGYMIEHLYRYRFSTNTKEQQQVIEESHKIRIRTHTMPSYTESTEVSSNTNELLGYRHVIPRSMHDDLCNLESDTKDEQNLYPIPREIDKETIHSWISTILNSTKQNDIRGVKLIHFTVNSLNLSTVYPPLYHALIFGHGKLGDIDTMLKLYQVLLSHHKQQQSHDIPIITSNIITTVLNNLSIYRRSIDGINIFNEYLNLPGAQPDINTFCMILKHCSLIGNWSLSKQFFTKMYKEYNIKPNDLCFKYLLHTCLHCKPPKYRESLSILHGMKKDWNITPNAKHFALVIKILATPFAYIENPLSQDIMIQIDNNNDFELYKFKLLHGKLFDETNHKLSDIDLQRCLDLFNQMIDEYDITPTDSIFASVYYACARAQNLEMALKYRKYWKHKYPNVRPTAYSFEQLLRICTNIKSWDDALRIYKSTALINYDEQNDEEDNDGYLLCDYDGDSLSMQAYHKVQPVLAVFNQLLRCAKQDISRQIYDKLLTAEEAEIEILKRIKFIESQMYNFYFNPDNLTWIFLFQSSAIIQSKDLCNRFLKRLFQFSMKPFQQKNQRAFMNRGDDKDWYQQLGDVRYSIPNEFKDKDSTWDNCWDYYDVNKFECRFVVFKSMIEALFWTNQIEQALKLYHDFYFIKKKFTHWYVDGVSRNINIDFHSHDPASSVVALLYIFKYEFQYIYDNLLSVNDTNDVNDRLEMNNNGKLEFELNLKKINGGNNDTKGIKNLQIITGHGKGNKTGMSILRPWIKSWLLNECKPPIKSYIHPRNVGLLVLDSIDVLAYIDANCCKDH